MKYSFVVYIPLLKNKLSNPTTNTAINLGVEWPQSGVLEPVKSVTPVTYMVQYCFQQHLGLFLTRCINRTKGNRAWNNKTIIQSSVGLTAGPSGPVAPGAPVRGVGVGGVTRSPWSGIRSPAGQGNSSMASFVALVGTVYNVKSVGN